MTIAAHHDHDFEYTDETYRCHECDETFETNDALALTTAAYLDQ